MTPEQEVYEALCSSGIQGTKIAYPLGGAPALPWFVYYRTRGGEFFGDGENYACLTRFTAELYMKENDPELKGRFEAAIATIGPFTSNETWLIQEGCYMTSYEFTHHPKS